MATRKKKSPTLTLEDVDSGKAGYDTFVRHVSPAIANDILEHRNRGNRPRKTRAIAKYATDMAEGNWRLTGEPILFDDTGRLLSGQNRMLACVEADVPFETAVTVGIDPDSNVAIDTGVSRTMGDVLRDQGEVNTHQLASVLSVTWRLVNGYMGDSGRHPSRQESLQVLDLNPSLRDRTRESNRLKQEFRLPSSAIATTFHQFGMIDRDLAELFADELSLGIGLEANTGPYLWRTWAARQARQTHNRPSTTHHVAMLIKAWNLWILGEKKERLQWARKKTGGTRNVAPFPEIVDPEGLVWKPIYELDKPA